MLAKLCCSVILLFAFSTATCLAEESPAIEVDYRALVSQSDLIYRSPAPQSIEGLPIGNGVMGTLVWTGPNAVYLQINRSDVFAVNKTHGGTFNYLDNTTDYGGACAQIAVDVGGQPFAPGKAFAQRLSLYDAETRIAGEGVRVRCFVSAAMDVLALEIDDRRDKPQPVRVTVSMWRPPEVIHGSHAARYQFVESADSALVVQRFQEKDYRCASAVAARIVDRRAEVQASSEKTRIIVAPAKKGKRTILISSAASWVPDAEVGKTAHELLDAAGKQTYSDLRGEHVRWWRDFWSRSFVHLVSDDGVAAFMQQIRSLHLYYMASSSRGPVPPKWNASIFGVNGDTRRWGTQYWVWTTEMLYWPLLAADAVALSDPFFNMYVKQLPDCEKAAVQRWNCKGVFFPETTGFDGPVVLPDDVAMEFQQVLQGKRKPKEMSDRAKAICRFESHLFESTHHAQLGPYSWISHVVSSGSELAVHAWWRYRHTGDQEWLRSHAYPLLRGSAEFYRTLVRKGADGRYHLLGTNAHEDFWGVGDSIMDLAAIRGTVPLAIRAAEILEIDADLRPQWKELLENLTPYPMGADPRSKALTGGSLADDLWSAGYLGDANGHHNPEDVWLNPVFPFEDWTLETRCPPVDRIVQKLLDIAPRHLTVLNQNGPQLNTAIRTPIATVRAGRGQQLPAILASYYAALSPLPNGMSMFEGPDAHSIEQLGLLTTTLQEGLLQSVSARPGEPEVISVFPAWPKHWQASFRLLARGGILVTSARGGGKVEFIEIESRLGETCRLRNPWSAPCQVTEIGGETKLLDGDLLRFDTARGKRYRVVPKDAEDPAPRRIAPPRVDEPTSYSLKMPNGKVFSGTLGRRK